jgi:hypothetical protein
MDPAIFSKQSRFGPYGKRWACLVTACLNVVEAELVRNLSIFEIKAAIGDLFLGTNVALANFAWWDRPLDFPKTAQEWSDAPSAWFHSHRPKAAHPWNDIVRSFCETFDVEALRNDYYLREIRTEFGGQHFALWIANLHQLVNPDPAVGGEIVGDRPIKLVS